MKKDFYFVGLGLLSAGSRFTPSEMRTLQWLAGEAQKSNACFWDACSKAVEGTPERFDIEKLKETLRALDKGPLLEAYYDRADKV
jgi:hypothetical protein